MKKFVESLRLLADFYEQHPDFPTPVLDGSVPLNIFIYQKKELKRLVRNFSPCEKKSIGKFFCLRRWFGEIPVDLSIYHDEVCRKVQVAVREIPEQVLPATDEKTIPAHTEPVYEWRCTDSLFADEESSSASEMENEA